MAINKMRSPFAPYPKPYGSCTLRTSPRPLHQPAREVKEHYGVRREYEHGPNRWIAAHGERAEEQACVCERIDQYKAHKRFRKFVRRKERAGQERHRDDEEAVEVRHVFMRMRKHSRYHTHSPETERGE